MSRSLILIWGLVFFVTPAFAESKPCVRETSNADIFRCLNDYAKSRLAAGSAADLRYQERLGRLLARYGLRPDQVQARSLDSTFSIYVSEEPELSSAVGKGKCFDFESLYGFKRRPLIEGLLRQIDEISFFLAEIQARTWGHQVSILFPIREVNICDRSKLNDRPLVFEQRSLVVGMVGAEPMAAAQILETWNSGSPIRSRETSYLDETFIGKKGREIYQKVNGDIEGMIRDRLADYWPILNPTGLVRTSAFYILTSAVLKYADRLMLETANLDTKGVVDRLAHVASGSGFTPQDRLSIEALKDRDGDAREVLNLWLERIRSSANKLYVIENAIGEKASQNAHLHLTLRHINAGLAVLNDKTISVRLEQLMQVSLPVSQFEERGPEENDEVEVTRSEPVDLPSGKVGTKSTTLKIRGRNVRDVRINADEVNGGIVVDLIDDVLVSVQMPKISPEAYGRISLFQALRDYQVGIRSGSGDPALP